MNIKRKMIRITFTVLAIAIFSCSKNEDNQQNYALDCLQTNVMMNVNGVPQSFQAIGRGIDLTQNGYSLSLNIDRRTLESSNEQGVALKLPYKLTGKNIIQNFIYHQYIDQIAFDGDFITQGNFQSEVFINRETCFLATFSGTLNDGNQEVVITSGVISFTYETPFTN